MTSFDGDGLKYNKLSYHKQVVLRIIVRPDKYDSRHSGIDFQHPHLCTLPVISADNIRNIYPHFTRLNIRRSAFYLAYTTSRVLTELSTFTVELVNYILPRPAILTIQKVHHMPLIQVKITNTYYKTKQSK